MRDVLTRPETDHGDPDRAAFGAADGEFEESGDKHEFSEQLLGRRSRAIRARRVGWSLALTLLVVLGPIVAPRTAQPASRYALSAAIVDHGTIDVTRYKSVLEIDHAIYEGKWRSDKGPGQPFAAAPVYALARVLGAAPLGADTSLVHDLVLWLLTITTSTIPFALLCMFAYRRAAKRASRGALAATVALLCGSIALPHAVNLYAHSLSALFGYLAFVAVADALDAPTSARASFFGRRPMLAGLCAGAAVAIEYHLAIVAIVIGLLIAVRMPRSLVAYAAGAAAPLGVLAWYQWRAFGAPWHTPFAYYAGNLGGTTEGGYSLPTVDGLWSVIAGNRGLAITGPVVVIGILFAFALTVRRTGRSIDAIAGSVIALAYVALVAGWSGTPWLEEPGPRYLIPAIAFLVTPLASVWPSIRRWVRLAAAAWGIAMMAAAATTFILVATNDTPVNAYVNRVAHQRFLPTVWSLALGTTGLWLYGASCALALRWLYQSVRVRLNG